MKPRVFVSSTIKDLHFLRESVRKLLLELGYEPVLSEHNGIPYLPDHTPTESCFKAVTFCDIAIVVISRRYGDDRVKDSDIGITHTEYRTAKSAGIPIYFLIDRDIHVMKEVWEENRGTTSSIDWPGIDRPDRIFLLAQEASRDSAYYLFSSAAEACSLLRTQFAYLFKELLTKQRMRSDSEQKSILQELAFIRKQIESAFPNSPMPRSFVTATSLFLEDSYKQLRLLMNRISRGLEASISDLLTYASLEEYLKAKKVVETLREETIAFPQNVTPTDEGRFVVGSFFAVGSEFEAGSVADGIVRPVKFGQFGLTADNKLFINAIGKEYLSGLYRSLRTLAVPNDSALNPTIEPAAP